MWFSVLNALRISRMVPAPLPENCWLHLVALIVRCSTMERGCQTSIGVAAVNLLPELHVETATN